MLPRQGATFWGSVSRTPPPVWHGISCTFQMLLQRALGGCVCSWGQGRCEPQPRARSVLWLTRLHLVPSVTCRAAGRGSFKERVPPPRDRAVPRPLTGRESTVTLPTTSVAVPRTCMSGARGRRYHGGRVGVTPPMAGAREGSLVSRQLPPAAALCHGGLHDSSTRRETESSHGGLARGPWAWLRQWVGSPGRGGSAPGGGTVPPTPETSPVSLAGAQDATRCEGASATVGSGRWTKPPPEEHGGRGPPSSC